MESQESHESPSADEPSGAEPPLGGGGRSPERQKISKGRLILVDGIIVVSTVLLVVGVFAVWANRLLFSPDNWSNTSSQLLKNPTIRSTTATYAVDKAFAAANVEGLLKSVLPPKLEPVAGPAANALEGVAVTRVNIFLQRPRVLKLWEEANRTADKAFIAIANGGKGPVGVNQGVVTLNLAQIVDDAAARLGLSSDLGSKLPPNFAHLVIIRSNQLKFVQKTGKAVKGLALWLTILVPVLYALAILLASHHRRRTLMSVGFAATLGGLLVIIGRGIFNGQIVDSLVKQASIRPAVSATVSISTQMLAQIAAACIVVGVVLVIAAWFAGPSRPTVAARRTIAPFLREQAVLTYVITLVVMALIFVWDPIHATGTLAGIIVFTLLALVGVFLLRRQTAREFPDARAGATTAAIKGRVDAVRGGREPTAAPGPETPEKAETPEAAEKPVPEQHTKT